MTERIRDISVKKNLALWNALGIKKEDSFKKPLSTIRIALLGEGVDFSLFPHLKDQAVPGRNFNSNQESNEIGGRSIRTGHEQSIAALLDIVSSKLGFRDRNLKIIPMVIAKPFYSERLRNLPSDELFLKKMADAISLSVEKKVDSIIISYASFSSYQLKFINNSRSESLNYLNRAARKAYNAGIPIFAATSNYKGRNQDLEPTFPCNLDKVICVANSQFDHNVRGASGKSIDIAFYGTNLHSFRRDGSPRTVSGSSYATPLLAFLFSYYQDVHQLSFPESLETFLSLKGKKVKSRFGLKQDKVINFKAMNLTQ